MNIGIFGGSFNPIHNGHILLAKQLLELARLDEIWFMVSPQNPLKKQSDLLDDNMRMTLVTAALKETPRLVACDYELTLPRPSYSWNTMRSLSRTFPQHVFTIIIGGDNWQCFPQWRNHEELIADYAIAVYPRNGSTIDKSTLPPGVRLYDTRLIDVSSTQIRRMIREGLSVDDLVPSVVAKIIADEKLYL